MTTKPKTAAEQIRERAAQQRDVELNAGESLIGVPTWWRVNLERFNAKSANPSPVPTPEDITTNH